MNELRVALLGNPNVGKTTLFNTLTGGRQRVGNWSGVTVEKKIGYFDEAETRIHVVDLPGAYTLTSSSSAAPDVQIACGYILSHQADIIVNIVDASNLERNLYLTVQLLEMQVPMVLAVNMMDIAKQWGIRLNLGTLSKRLGCPVVPLVSRQKKGIQVLKRALLTHARSLPIIPKYTQLLESVLVPMMQVLKREYRIDHQQVRSVAMRLLENNMDLIDQYGQTSDMMVQIKESQQKIKSECGVDAALAFADARYQFLNRLLAGIQSTQITVKQVFTHKLDAIILNRWLGIPIFLFMMYLMFQFSITLGGTLQPLFDDGSRVIFVDSVDYLGVQWGCPAWLIAIAAQGLGLGINTVLTFVPQIGALFLFLCFLEGSGYMARAAFVMDKVMQAVGLPGKSFVPLIIGFGCNVPAIMATRTLGTRRDRLLTIMMSPFMSCGARLAIFSVFSTAFFPHGGAFVVFILYFIGMVVALLTGLLLKKTLLKGKPAPFIMELPTYHWPHFKNLFIHTWHRLKYFVFRAGRVIIPICLLVGSLNSIQWNGKVDVHGSPHSLLSQVGRMVTPVFHPMGIESNNWPATVSLITGTLAKEVVIGTLNTLYTQNNNQPVEGSVTLPHFNVLGGLQGAWHNTVAGFSGLSMSTVMNPFTAREADHNMTQTAMGHMTDQFGSMLSAFAFMVFVLLYIPCVSAMGTIAREAGRVWAWFSLLWSVVIAYALAVIVFQIGTIVIHPLSSIVWIAAMLLSLGLLILSMYGYAMKLSSSGASPLRNQSTGCVMAAARTPVKSEGAKV